MNKVKVAIIGYGHLGKWHAQKAQALETAELVAIVEINKDNHEAIKSEYPHVIVCSDLMEVIDQIDAAVIVTPTSYHALVACELLEHGKHIFCEKPLCSNMKEVAKIKELQKGREELVFQVGHSERFHQVWAELKSYFSKTSGGMIELTRISSFKNRATDVDVVQDLMIHDIDLLYFLFDAQIKNLNVQGIKNISSHWDHVSTLFELNHDNKAWISVSRNSCTEERSLRVTDRRGEVFVDLMNLSYEIRDHKGGLIKKESYPKRDHLFEEQKSFYSSILNKTKPIVSLDDGVKAVEVIESILQKLEH